MAEGRVEAARQTAARRLARLPAAEADGPHWFGIAREALEDVIGTAMMARVPSGRIAAAAAAMSPADPAHGPRDGRGRWLTQEDSHPNPEASDIVLTRQSHCTCLLARAIFG